MGNEDWNDYSTSLNAISFTDLKKTTGRFKTPETRAQKGDGRQLPKAKKHLREKSARAVMLEIFLKFYKNSRKNASCRVKFEGFLSGFFTVCQKLGFFVRKRILFEENPFGWTFRRQFRWECQMLHGIGALLFFAWREVYPRIGMRM
ncbi:MAG: hypothetical protein IKS83_01980 [Victivallales bacterium]|nr:hypothetical protein [Victivallales bacterium]